MADVQTCKIAISQATCVLFTDIVDVDLYPSHQSLLGISGGRFSVARDILRYVFVEEFTKEVLPCTSSNSYR